MSKKKEKIERIKQLQKEVLKKTEELFKKEYEIDDLIPKIIVRVNNHLEAYKEIFNIDFPPDDRKSSSNKLNKKRDSKLKKVVVTDKFRKYIKGIEENIDTCIPKENILNDFLSNSDYINENNSQQIQYFASEFFAIFTGDYLGWKHFVIKYNGDIEDDFIPKLKKRINSLLHNVKIQKENKKTEEKSITLIESIIQGNLKGLAQKELLNQFSKAYKEKIKADIEFDTQIFIEETINEILENDYLDEHLLKKIDFFFNPISLNLNKFNWTHRAILCSAITLSILNSWQEEKIQILKRLITFETPPLLYRRIVVGISISILQASREYSQLVYTLNEYSFLLRDNSFLEKTFISLEFFLKNKKINFTNQQEKFFNLFKLNYTHQYLEVLDGNTSYIPIKGNIINFNEQKHYFIDLLNKSISFSFFEKINIIISLPILYKNQFKSILDTLNDESKKIHQLKKKFGDDIIFQEMKRHYTISSEEFIFILESNYRFAKQKSKLTKITENTSLNNLISQLNDNGVIRKEPTISNLLKGIIKLTQNTLIQNNDKEINLFIEKIKTIDEIYVIGIIWAQSKVYAYTRASFSNLERILLACEKHTKLSLKQKLLSFLELGKILKNTDPLHTLISHYKNTSVGNNENAVKFEYIARSYEKISEYENSKRYNKIIIDYYDKSLESNFDLDILLRKGWHFFTSLKHSKANDCFKKILNNDKVHKHALMNLGHCQLIFGYTDKAINLYKRSVDNFESKIIFFKGMNEDYKYIEEKIDKNIYNNILKNLSDYAINKDY